MPENQPIEYRHLLAPIKLQNGDVAFESVKELIYACSLPECRNIALTGVYGSGKSSVISTFLDSDKNSVPKKILRISLSNFEDEEPSLKDKYENDIEYKVFQHILYKSDINKTQCSRYKRLKIIGDTSIQKLSIGILQFFLCYIIAFEPKCLQIDSIYYGYHSLFGLWANRINFIADLGACCWMFRLIYRFMPKLIHMLSGLSIQSFKAKDVEVNMEKPVFNQLLDEILYFFKAGEYNAVIFEDLDRIKNPSNLFLKFREINLLLNESEDFLSQNRKIIFIYAIKDDVFKDEIRTKCFDYIVPVVPVVDSHNVSDYLIYKYSSLFTGDKQLDETSKRDLIAIGSYITGMRELSNVINEYIVYKNTIRLDKKSWQKLLAMTIFKNKFPTDYSDLHNKKGCLCNIFSQRSKFEDLLTHDDSEQLLKCVSDYEKVRKQIFGYRKQILDEWVKKEHVTAVIVDEKEYNLDAVEKSDVLYSKFEDEEIDRVRYDDGKNSGTKPYSYSFDVIKADIDVDNVYYETMDKLIESRDDILSLMKERQRNINIIKNRKLQSLITAINNGKQTLKIVREITGDIRKDNNSISEFLHSMIRNGYIAEDFSSYTSYSYPGTMSSEDSMFYNSVLQGLPTAYDMNVTNCKAIVDGLKIDHFNSKSILNFCILDYLLNITEDQLFLDRFVLTARSNPSFVAEYSKTEKADKRFFMRLFDQWNLCVRYIGNIEETEVRVIMKELFFQYAPLTISLYQDERKKLNESYSYLASNIDHFDINILLRFIKKYKLKFDKLVEPIESSQVLYDNVIAGCYYVVNYGNLKVIYGDDFDHKPYTLICQRDQNVKAFVSRNINQLVELFSDKANEEEKSALVELINNGSLDAELMKTYLGRQILVFDDFNLITDKRKPDILRLDKITPSWVNIEKYVNAKCDTKVLAEFVERHVAELERQRASDENSEVLLALFTDNDTLSYETYNRLAHCFKNCFDASEMDKLNNERLKILLDNNLVGYDMETKAIYSKDYSLHAKYIIKFFDDFEKENEDIDDFSSSACIEIINSSLSSKQKAWFIEKFVTIGGDSTENEQLGKEICKFYFYDADANNIFMPVAIDSLNSTHDPYFWDIKIGLINKIHAQLSVDKYTTGKLVKSLGNKYEELLKYGWHITSLDNNSQNKELIKYLKSHLMNISNVSVDGNQIKVSYHHKEK